MPQQKGFWDDMTSEALHSGYVCESGAWAIKKGMKRTWWARRYSDGYVLGPFRTLTSLKAYVAEKRGDLAKEA